MPQSIQPIELAGRLRRGEPTYVLDVRQPGEHAFARIEPTHLFVPLPQLPARRAEVQPPPGAAIVVYCHHGVRSWNAAQFLEAVGHAGVLSLAGGIDAWSREMDPAVPRY